MLAGISAARCSAWGTHQHAGGTSRGGRAVCSSGCGAGGVDGGHTQRGAAHSGGGTGGELTAGEGCKKNS